MTFFYLLLALALAGILVRQRFFSFEAQRPEDYADGPAFHIREVMTGPLDCEGVIYGPGGRVASRFTAEMEGSWDGDDGVLKEHFVYDSGARQDREWKLNVSASGHVTATAGDILGLAQGRQVGSAVRLAYKIRLTEAAGGHVLDVVDWMYLMPNGTVLNRSQFRKFGFQVAELVASIRPRNADNDGGAP